MSRSRPRTSRAVALRPAVVGAIVLGLALTGCGGTRESQEAIQAAAGVGPAAQVPVAQAPGTAVAPGTPASGTPNVDPNTGTGQPSAGAQQPVESNKAAANKTTDSPAKQKNAASNTDDEPAAGVQGQPQEANKSPIKLGVVGTFSGPVGTLVKDTVTGVRVWGQWVNARGGVNGHPVEILVGDDGGDPARFNSILQQFVEQEGALAMLYTTLGFAPNGNNKYLDSKKIFTFGTEGGLEAQYTNPFVLSPLPAGLTNADSILLALGDVARPLGKTKFGYFACSDFGICDNFATAWSNPAGLKRAGFELVASGRPSLTQPDFTAQCLAAKQAGAEVVMLSMDTASLRRIAGNCARQDYRPIFGTADLLATSALPSDPNVDGLIVATKMAPWLDTSVPGIAELHKAFAQFQPGAPVTGGASNGWAMGQFFAAAGAALPDTVTPEDIEDGLYQIKKNNLDGMTYPITMTRGKPMERQLCYGAVVVKDGQYTKVPGKALRCAPPLPTGKASASVASSMQPATAEGPTIDWSALTARTSTGSRFLGMSAPVPAALFRRPSVASDCSPARVTGISYVLDAFQTGSSAGPGVFYGVLLAVIGTPVPEPFGQYQGQFIAQGSTFVEQVSNDGPAAIQDSRKLFEPFAAHNGQANAFVDAGADSFDAAAESFGPFIQPGDRSMEEFADALRDAKAPMACSSLSK